MNLKHIQPFQGSQHTKTKSNTGRSMQINLSESSSGEMELKIFAEYPTLEVLTSGLMINQQEEVITIKADRGDYSGLVQKLLDSSDEFGLIYDNGFFDNISSPDHKKPILIKNMMEMALEETFGTTNMEDIDFKLKSQSKLDFGSAEEEWMGVFEKFENLLEDDIKAYSDHVKMLINNFVKGMDISVWSRWKNNKD